MRRLPLHLALKTNPVTDAFTSEKPSAGDGRDQLRRHLFHRFARNHARAARVALQADRQRHVEEHRIDLAPREPARFRCRAAVLRGVRFVASMYVTGRPIASRCSSR